MSQDPVDKMLNELEGDNQAPSNGTVTGSTAKDRNLSLIMDIPLRVTVELGRTKMPVSELLNLTKVQLLS